MTYSDYLVVGGSHAGLAAIDAISMADPDAPITLLTREDRLPYSPTVLPHVMSGRVSLEDVLLRNQEDLQRSNVTFRRGTEVSAVDPRAKLVQLAFGGSIEYGKLLLATGASPAVPPVPGLEDLPYHVLRTAEDAEGLRAAVLSGGEAVIVGGGLIGMHAAETMANKGMQVTVVEALPRILSEAFDAEVAGRIAEAFETQKVRILAGSTVESTEAGHGGTRLHLSTGERLRADLLLVATGVRPRLEGIAGSSIEVDRGILVDDRMRTSAENVWAAGDVAQASDFFGRGRRILPTLTDAVEQGRTAGKDMAGDPEAPAYPGGIGRNTFCYFGHGAFAVGLSREQGEEKGHEIDCHVADDGKRYQALLFQVNRLVGATGIDSDLDPGVLAELVRRGEDLNDLREAPVSSGRDVSRLLMSDRWR